MKSRGGLGREVREPLPLPRFYFFALLFTSHRSPLSERLEQAISQSVSQFIGLIPHLFHIGVLGQSVFNSTTRIPYQDQKKTFNYLVGEEGKARVTTRIQEH